MLPKNSETSTLTFQTRLSLNQHQSSIMSQMALLLNTVEHSLFAEMQKGKKASDLKAPFLKKYSITARHFNSLRSVLEGKISSIKEQEKRAISNLKQRIVSLESTIIKLEKKNSNPSLLHQKKRRHVLLKNRLQQKEKHLKEERVKLCFGTRKRFRKQFNLKANKYSSHEEWKKEWQQVRANNFFLVGSKDETAGNQSCVVSIHEDALTLRIRLPDALLKYGKYLIIEDVRFSYGHATIIEALKSGAQVAISYRFLQDLKGWRVFLSLPIQKPPILSQRGIGVIGVDINADHLAVVETDRFGNLIARKSYPLCTYGKTPHQTKALIGDLAKSIVDWCIKTKKPLVHESLSFDKKKSELREIGNAKYARMLSSLAYNLIISMLRSRAFRSGVRIREVNPAYTSIIGRIKFAKRYGLSIHESAALVIGRRYLRNSERLPSNQSIVSDGKGHYVTMLLPVRNRSKHVWSIWRKVQKEFLKWCMKHIFGRKKAILKPESLACCDMRFLNYCWRDSNTRIEHKTAR